MFPARDLVDRLIRKLRRPYRRRAWSRKTSPFVHKGAKKLRFRLQPGEYLDGDIYVEGIYELYYLRYISRNFGGGTLLDVGANIGNHALYLADRFDDVHCFEPVPALADRLADNAALNGITVHIHRIGLGAENGELPFYPTEVGNPGTGSFAPRYGDAVRTLPVRKGDDYLAANNISGVSFIKIDVEGYELQVIEGLRETINRDLPTMVFEFDGARNDFAAVANLLPDYSFLVLTPDGPKSLRPERKFYEAIIAHHRRVTVSAAGMINIKRYIYGLPIMRPYRLWRAGQIAQKLHTVREGFSLARNCMHFRENWEPRERAAMSRLLPECAALIDVGANIGFYSLLASKLGKPSIAVEPDAGNLVVLRRNLAGTNAEVFAGAVSDKAGNVDLFGDGDMASFDPEWQGVSKRFRQSVQAITLDALIGDRWAGERLFIKVDVEGAEALVLRGAQATLTRDPKPYWLIETTRTLPRGAPNPAFDEVHRLMGGYRAELTSDGNYLFT